MRLQEVMSTGVVTAGPDEAASAALERMREHGIRHLVIVQNGDLKGIVSERDLGGARAREMESDYPVREVMSTDLVTVRPATTLRQAANLMRGRSIGSLLVVDEGKLVGLVTTTDLLDQLGRGATRPTVSVEPAPLRRPPASGLVRGRKAARAPAGPRTGRRSRRPAAPRQGLPSQLPRAEKPARGRPPLPPAHVRAIGAELSEGDRENLARKLGMRLGKFASSIERISVRLSDVNGPRGGADHMCAIKVVLNGLPSVVVKRTEDALQGAIDSAIDATALAVQSAVRKRRLKPRRGRAAAAQGW